MITRNNIPNFFTLTRIFLIPILVGSFYLGGIWTKYVATCIFVFASITDYIDGKLARTLNAQTSFGRMLDPIADKMVIITTLVMLVDQKIAPILPILAIICREIFVSGMREYLATKSITIKVNFLGKIKTTLQIIAIILLLLGSEGTNIIYAQYIGKIVLWVAAILTIISGYVYLREGFKHVHT